MKKIFSFVLFSVFLTPLFGQADWDFNSNDELQQAKIIGAGFDEFGQFVEFELPISNVQGRNRWITKGQVYQKIGHDPRHELLRFRSKSDEDKEAYFSVVSGFGARIKSENGDWFSPFYPFATLDVVRKDYRGDITKIWVRWYPTQSQLSFPLRYEIRSIIDGNANASNTGNKKYELTSSHIFNNPLDGMTLNTRISDQVGKMSINYSYAYRLGSSNDNYNSHYKITHWPDSDPTNIVQDATNLNPAGTVNIDRLNEEQRIIFHSKFTGKDNRITYTDTKEIIIPAYIWPDNIQVEYNKKDAATISWKVKLPAVGTSFIDGGKFEIQRSTDSTFEVNVKSVETKPEYDPQRENYSVVDDLSDLKGGTKVFYRLRRVHPEVDWSWKAFVSDTIDVNIFNTIVPDSAVLIYTTEGPAASISWSPVEGVWPSGSTVTLTKINNTTGTVQQTIDLDKDEARSGNYIDKYITYCNEFSYTIKAKVGGGYSSPGEVSIPGKVLAIKIGNIKNLIVSKGYFPDRTLLKWKSEGTFDNYLIKRKIYGSNDEFVQISSVPGTELGDIQFEDEKGTPGVYYQYMVIGAVKCNQVTEYSPDTLYSIGFRAPTGNVYGRVTYENGQAVNEVAIRLENNEPAKGGKSIYLNGHDSSFIGIPLLATPFRDSTFSIKVWIKPEDKNPLNQTIFLGGNSYELGFDSEGRIFFRFDNEIIKGDYLNENNSFIHVAGIHSGDSLKIMLNDNIIASGPVSGKTSSTVQSVLIGRNHSGNNFKGYIDELQLWSFGLTQAYISKNYSRLLAGDEAGLIAYWRFDESIPGEFYDISHREDNYNKNDGILNNRFVSQSPIIPGSNQLSLKGFTDSTGNYMITGIPYSGVNGTIYKIVPLLGTHQFDPVSINRLFSASTSTFTLDFVDRSSFPVSGYVYYKNSTVPVKGVQFKIDGVYAQEKNGNLIETNPEGKFTISVPIGYHEVKAVKVNHVFVNDGKITDRHGENLNYQGPLSERVLHDSTTIRFIGRVSGGHIQSDYPLGHSLSRNNLGEKLSISLQLPNADRFSLNLNPSGADSLVTIKHLLPAKQKDTSKAHQTRVKFTKNSIEILPDALTGEFAVDILPENFIVTNVAATGHANIIGSERISIDFSDKFVKENEIYEYVQEVNRENDVKEEVTYSDTVFYNYSYKFTQQNTPVLEINQLNTGGKPLPYFGDTTYVAQTFSGDQLIVPVYESASGTYLFNFPIFHQGKKYSFGIKSFEQYEYFKEDNPDNPFKTDQVPSEGLVTFENDLQNGQTDTLSLNKEGEGIYYFSAGNPELNNPKGRKGLSASIQTGSMVIQWKNGNKLEGFIMGAQKTGNDFVTAGPDQILYVLRDPGGSNSYAFLEKGSVITTETEFSGAYKQSGDYTVRAFLGSKIVTIAGSPTTGVEKEIKVDLTQGYKLSHEENYMRALKTITTTTLLTRYQTSNDPSFVGASSDVFIGNSTNLTLSNSINLTIIRNNEIKNTDEIFFSGKDYSIIKRDGISISQNYGTHFLYTAMHIEDNLIPGLIALRNSYLLPKTITSAEAQQMANNTRRQVYVSKLDSTDPAFGASNGDESVFGPNSLMENLEDGSSYKIYFPVSNPEFRDTISIINQWVTKWIERLSDNEKAKYEAKKSVIQNYSFTSGADVEHSYQSNYSSMDINSFDITVGGDFFNIKGAESDGKGMKYTLKEGLSAKHAVIITDDSTSTKSFGFVLSEDGSDYLSIDVSKAKDSSFVFSTKGGVTSCPYEGEVKTKYYMPGQTLDQPTMQREIPDITVDKPVVSDIPSNRSATFTIHLQNASTQKGDIYFGLHVIDKSNPYGAKITMDGATLAGGRNLLIPSGEVLTKTIVIERGPDSLDYRGLQLVLHSTCQYDPVVYKDNIADTISLSAHFIPSCSDISIQSPDDKWTLNTNSPKNNKGEHYLPLILGNFDVNYNLFDHIAIQFKSASAANWITVNKFYADSALFKEAQGEAQMINGKGKVSYDLIMNDLFSDQNYNVRALNVCMDNGLVIAQTPSQIINGVKDTYRPRLFGSPQPADGILGIRDDIKLNFNENIDAGLLTVNNFKVTGVRNGAKTNHSVSIMLNGESSYLKTEFEKNLTGKNITAEMWVLPDGHQNETIFSHGNIHESMEVGFTADNHLDVIVGSKRIKSDKPIDYKKGEWVHVAVVLNATTGKVSAFYNFIAVINDVSIDKYTGKGPFVYGYSLQNNDRYFSGKIHEARVWTTVLTGTSLQVNSLKNLNGGEKNLLAYFPMNEGKGKVAIDKAYGANARIEGEWSKPAGRSLQLNGQGYLKINSAYSPLSSDMDYTISLWFRGVPGQMNATLMSNGRADGTDSGDSQNLVFLGFEEGKLTFKNYGTHVQIDRNLLDNNWHQVAITVNRISEVGQIFIDGELQTFFDTQNLGGFASAETYLGARVWYDPDDALTPVYDWYFKGDVDEFRIWNTYLNQTLINSFSNKRLGGDEMGLMAYYPFEKYYMFQNNQELDSTLSDQKIQKNKNVQVPAAIAVAASITNNMAPVIDRGPSDKLQFDFVVNNDALIINLLEPKQTIDKTIVTLQAEDLRDRNGNSIASPVTWTAYINQGQLKWSDDKIDLKKDLYAPQKFETYVENKGGSNQQFKLDNLPLWLTAIPSMGTIASAGREKIVFQVNEGINVGSYDEVIYLISDNDIAEPLQLNIEVQGKKPEWTVDPGDYKYNMSVYGQLKVNGQFRAHQGDMLGVFKNGKCIGVSNSEYSATLDLWYHFLTIYSDTIQYDNLEFRIWDPTTGKTFLAIPSIKVLFKNDAIIGSPRNPVVFEGREFIFQNIELNRGWNWISFNVHSDMLENTNKLFENGNWKSGDEIKNATNFDQYSTKTEKWTQTMKGFNNLQLYMLKTGNQQKLSLSGALVNVKETPVPLKGNGWNYISYLPQKNMTVAEALAGYRASDEDVIKSQNGFAMYDSRGGWVGNLKYMEPGKGYMLYRNNASDTSFYYPEISGIIRLGNDLITGRKGLADINTKVETFDYSGNMTMIVKVGEGFMALPGDKLVVFAGNENRGEALLTNNSLTGEAAFFLTISGEQEQSLRFKIERNGILKAVSSSEIQFKPNIIMGTLAVPFVLHFNTGSLEITFAPNPFNSRINGKILFGGKSEQRKIQMNVYDLSGRLIISQAPIIVNSNSFNISWDGLNDKGKECSAGMYLITIEIDGKAYTNKVLKVSNR